MDITAKIPIIRSDSSEPFMMGIFGCESGGEKIPYDFIVGDYSIYGYYKSDYPLSEVAANLFVGELYTPAYNFTIS